MLVLESLFGWLRELGVAVPAWATGTLGLILAALIGVILLTFIALFIAVLVWLVRRIQVGLHRLRAPIPSSADDVWLIELLRRAKGADKPS